jgi:pimeloyl-ACP methyl ester carboxylesterase
MLLFSCWIILDEYQFRPHEIGAYDIPSFIDYVLNATGHASLYYVGHSFGNTVLFIALSLKPEYNNKIKCVAALCPAVYGNHVQKFCIRMGGPLGTIVVIFSLYDIDMSNLISLPISRVF